MENTGLNWVDLVVLIVMLAGTILGLLSGFVWQVYRIVTLILGVFFCSRYARTLSDYLGAQLIRSEAARLFVSYIAIFLVVLVACYVIGRFIKGAINKLKFGPMDTVFGGLMGLLKGALVCGVVLIGVFNFSPEESAQVEAIRSSIVARRLVIICKNLYGILPSDFRESVSDKLAGLKKDLEEKAGEKAIEEIKEGAKEAGGKEGDKSGAEQKGAPEKDSETGTRKAPAKGASDRDVP